MSTRRRVDEVVRAHKINLLPSKMAPELRESNSRVYHVIYMWPFIRQGVNAIYFTRYVDSGRSPAARHVDPMFG